MKKLTFSIVFIVSCLKQPVAKAPVDILIPPEDQNPTMTCGALCDWDWPCMWSCRIGNVVPIPILIEIEAGTNLPEIDDSCSVEDEP